MLTGSPVPGGVALGDWLVAPAVVDAVGDAVGERLASYHAQHPLEVGADRALARTTAVDAARRAGAPPLGELADALLDAFVDRGSVVRDGTTLRLAAHRVELGERSMDVERLLDAIGGEREATPPSVEELVAAGIERDVIDAAARSGAVVRVAPDLVMTNDVVARAEAIVRAAGIDGITVSAFREALGTSRKYAMPLLGWFDHRGITRRDGDLRFPRDV